MRKMKILFTLCLIVVGIGELYSQSNYVLTDSSKRVGLEFIDEPLKFRYFGFLGFCIKQ